MDIKEAVRNAWANVVKDFDEACKNATAIFWNEQVLRMDFFRHLFSQEINILRFSAECEINIGEKTCKPDLIIHALPKDATIILSRLVFEFKFYGTKWKEDWDRVLSYREVGFNQGYFLAIGPGYRADEIERKSEKVDGYEAEAIVHVAEKGVFRIAPPAWIAEELLRKALDIPYYVGEIIDGPRFAVTVPQDYNIIFDVWSKEDKCLLLIGFHFEPESEKWDEMESKLKEAGFEKYVELDEETFTFQPSETFTSAVMLEELEANNRPENIQKAKECLNRLKPALVGLKPALKVR